MAYGYNGKILHVNLTERKWEVETPSEVWYRTYVGGASMALYYLLKHIQPGVNPVAPENVLVFTCSVVTGAPLSGFSRYTVAAKSPLTYGFGKSEAGGYFGPELKFAGFDAIVISGRAEYPVYIYLHDEMVEIRKADSIWGRNNWETLERLKSELGDKRIRVASIGPAGERQIPFACIQNDLEHFNGRAGLGAVMGSKNLKAVVARGRKRIELADPEKVKEIRNWHNDRIKVHPPNVGLSKVGTSGLVKGLNSAGILPTHNFRDGIFEGVDKIDAEAYHSTIFHSAGTCYACSVKCKRRVFLKDEMYPLNPKYGGPEFEALGCLGSLLDNDNLPSIARANQLCNLYGLDVISTGCIIAFAMECFENGILTESDTDGKKLEFGDANTLLWLIEEIINQRGIGKVLAQGVKKAAAIIGRGADEYAFHIKGSELPVHDGRGKTGMALGYALSSMPDHVECPHDTAFAIDVSNLQPVGILEPVKPLETDADKVRYFSLGQRIWGINNCYGICNFCSVPIHAMTFKRLVESVKAITGWDTSLFEIMQVSERFIAMSRVFNCREGFGPKDDCVIHRWHKAMPEGPLKGERIDEKAFRDAINLYYELSGWDKNGNPLKGKLVELNLNWLVDENDDSSKS